MGSAFPNINTYVGHFFQRRFNELQNYQIIYSITRRIHLQLSRDSVILGQGNLFRGHHFGATIFFTGRNERVQYSRTMSTVIQKDF